MGNFHLRNALLRFLCSRIPQLNISASSPPLSPASGNGMRVKVEPLSPRDPPYPTINGVVHQQHNLSRPHSAHSCGLSPGPSTTQGGVQALSPGMAQSGSSAEVRNHQHNQQHQLHLAMQQQQHFNDSSCNPMPLQKRLRVSTESAGSGGVWSS